MGQFPKYISFFKCSILLLLLLILSIVHVYSQAPVSSIPNKKNTITGLVTDKRNGAPLVGVNVVIQGENAGTVTDSKGNYVLNVPVRLLQGKLKLVFSYVGYISQEISVDNNTVANVALSEDNSKLDEVIVVGYGSVKRRDLTGSISSVSAKTLTESNVTSFAEALQGRVAGVHVNAQSGEPGGGINIEIRGANSINAGSSPLYVIDGIPMDSYSNEVASSSTGGYTTYNPLSILAPSDIESIEILKDASATAIYGARGANGVIIITTKSGKAGSKTTFSLNSSYGISKINKTIPMLDGQEYVDYRHALSPTNEAWGRDIDGDGIIDTSIDASGYISHNWQDELYRKGSISQTNLSMQGSAGKTTFAGGFGILNQKGLVNNNNYKSYTGRIKLDTKASDKLTVGLSANWSRSINTGVASSGGGSASWTGLIQSIYTFRPIMLIAQGEDETQARPLSTVVYDVYRSTDYNRIIGNAYLNYKILKNLTLNVTGGGNYSSSKLSEYDPSTSLWGNSVNGRAILQEIQSSSYNATATLQYETKFALYHSLKLLAGAEINAYKYETFRVSSTNFLDESTGVFNISKGTSVEIPTSNVYDMNRKSFFGRLNYDFKGKYLLTATLRGDGSSNFGNGNRYGYFPSAAIAWRIKQEDFLKSITAVSDLKLRVGYGVTGNDRITPYQSMATLSSVYYASDGSPIYGAAPTTSANPDLKWETTSQSNIGLDLALFNSRISFTADAYYKKTTNMLLQADVPAQTGFLKQWQNLGDLENKGFELTLNTTNVATKDFTWTTSVNFYKNKNKILSLGSVASIPVTIANGPISTVGIVQEGAPLGTAYGYEWTGIYQISDFTWQNNSDPAIPYSSRTFTLKAGLPTIAGLTVKPGDMKYKDLDTNGTINSSDRKIISNSNPKFAGGFSSEVNYKNFTLNVFFEGVYGNKIFNSFPTMVESGQGEITYNLTKDYWYNRWTPDNPTNRYAAITNNTDNLASTYFVEDGSYLRFKTLSLGYNLGQSIVKKLKIQGLKVYGLIDNVHVWTKYSGLDPDIRSSTNLLPGYDRGSYPRPRNYTIGLNLTF